MENNEVNEISLLDLWLRIWKNKYLVAIITLVITILGVGVLYFINRGSGVAVTSVDIDFLYLSDEQYPDKTPFNYRTLVSLENLDKVKKTNEAFKDIDVDKLSKDESTKVVKREVLNKKDEVIQVYYDIKLPMKYFNNNKDLATDFLIAITDDLIETVKEKIDLIQIVNNLENADAVDYFDLVQLFIAQAGTIRTAYTNFSSRFGNIILNNTTIFEKQVKFNNWYNYSVRIAELEERLIETGYSNLSQDQITEKIEFIKNQITRTTNQLTELEQLTKNSGLTDADSVGKEFVNLTAQKQALISKQEYYEKALGKITTNEAQYKDSIKTFGSGLGEFIKEFDIYRKEFDSFNKDAIKLNIKLNYEEANKIVTVDKKFNMPLMAAVVLILGGIVGVSTALIKEAAFKNKELDVK